MTTFILLHGSFHAAWNWHKLIPLLEGHGHRCVALDLPGHGLDDTPAPRVSLPGCVARVLEAVDETRQETGDDAILVAHSRNGIVISAAAEARPASIRGLVYLAAYLVPTGKSMMDYAVLDTESLVVQNLVPRFDPQRVERTMKLTRSPLGRRLLALLLPSRLQSHALRPAAYREALYHDCPEEIGALADALLEAEPNWPGFTPLELTAERFGRVPKIYIECTEDRAVTPALQRRMWKDTPCDRVLSLASGHSPFFSRPAELAALLVEAQTVIDAASEGRARGRDGRERGGERGDAL